MLAPLLTIVMAMVPSADGTHLAPGPAEPGPPVAASTPVAPAPTPFEAPLVSLAAIAAAAAVLAGGLLRFGGDDEPAPGDALGLAEDPLVVFVPGHGTPGPETFLDLADRMDLEPDDYRVFDYRWAVETTDNVHASQAASIDDTADALNAYVAGLADGERDLYLVGFSKGGAGIAEMVSRWDDGAPNPVDGVIGATLLEPPISGGFQGAVQSLGRFVGPIPDDGGYSPYECDWSGLRCADNRDYLGEGSGVEVLVLRNPRAGVTSFDDRPEGLRVYDVPDEGRGPLASLFHNPFSYFSRVAEAHNAVLHDQRVADCIRAEMTELGSCDIGPTAKQVPWVRSDGGGWARMMPATD